MVRLKNRYFLLRVVWQPPAAGSKDQPRTAYPPTGKALLDSLVAVLDERFGAFGRGALRRSCAVKLWAPESGYAIVRAARDWHGMAKQCLTRVDTVDGTPARLQLEHVGGSIYSCVRHATAAAREELARLARSVRG